MEKKKALERISDRREKYKEAYEKAKQRRIKGGEALAYIAGIIDGEGSICMCVQKKRIFQPGIHIANDDKKMLLFVKKILKLGNVYERKSSKSRLRNSWAYRLWGREQIVKVLIKVRPFLITKQRQADLMFEFCVTRLELRKPYTERDYEIFREIKALNARRVD